MSGEQLEPAGALVVACCAIESAAPPHTNRHDIAYFWTACGIEEEAMDAAVAMLRGRCSWCGYHMSAWVDDDSSTIIAAIIAKAQHGP